jgi:hypothetical protein
MVSRRLSDSSVDLSEVYKLYDESLTSSAEICLYDHPSLQLVKANQKPRFRVYLTRLEPRIRIYSDARMTRTVACSRDVAECVLSEGEGGQPTEAFLYDASSVGQVMCLGVGRYPHNQLRPFVGDSVAAYYDDPDQIDPACICGQISRDHGLVFLSTDGTVRFRDFGTKKSGRRGGSKNGSWINGEYRLQNGVVDWREGDYLGIGGRVWVRRDGQLVKEHVFKLRYEKVQDLKETKHGEPDPDAGDASPRAE